RRQLAGQPRVNLRIDAPWREVARPDRFKPVRRVRWHLLTPTADMVRRGSTVRVRQRAYGKGLQSRPFRGLHTSGSAGVNPLSTHNRLTSSAKTAQRLADRALQSRSYSCARSRRMLT